MTSFIQKLNYYIYGAGVLFFFIIMLTTSAYSGILFNNFDLHIYRYTYGAMGDLFKAIIGCCVLAAVCCAIYFLSFILHLIDKCGCIRVIFNLVGLAFFIAVLVCEVVFITSFKYSGNPYPERFAYCNKEDFRNHLISLNQNYCDMNAGNARKITEEHTHNSTGIHHHKIQIQEFKQNIESYINQHKNQLSISDEIKMAFFQFIAQQAVSQFSIEFVYLNNQNRYQSASVESCYSIGDAMSTSDGELMQCANEVLKNVEDGLDIDTIISGLKSSDINVVGCDRLENYYSCLGLSPSDALEYFLQRLKNNLEKSEEQQQEYDENDPVKVWEMNNDDLRTDNNLNTLPVCYFWYLLFLIIQVLCAVFIIVATIIDKACCCLVDR